MRGDKVKSLIYLENEERLILNIRNRGVSVYDARNLQKIGDRFEGKDMNVTINSDNNLLFLVSNNEGDKSTCNAIVNALTLEKMREKTFSLNSPKWWITTHTTRKGYNPVSYTHLTLPTNREV